ncbi:MAG: hypothetical protein JRN06_05755 [Nitrososphaerota archaeon]|nr:hypothetical protein [Nitrososphaerota archaeon]MDG7024120.1 hypothetical protein [Nitrososphaerota archaeon]
MAKIALWQVIFCTVFVLALPTYLPDLSWAVYLVACLALFGLWAAVIYDLKRRWRSILQRYFHKEEGR